MLAAGWKLVPPTTLPLRSFGVFDPGRGVDEDKAVAEAAMQEDRNGGQRLALVADHEIGADILFADVEFVLAAHAPVPFARSLSRREK